MSDDESLRIRSCAPPPRLCLVTAGCALKSPPDRSELLKHALGDAAPPAQWRRGARSVPWPRATG